MPLTNSIQLADKHKNKMATVNRSAKSIELNDDNTYEGDMSYCNDRNYVDYLDQFRSIWLHHENVYMHPADLGNISNSYRFESTFGYGSCNDSLVARDVYSWERNSSQTNPQRDAKQTANTLNVIQPPGMYYVTIDMNHYLNGPSSPFVAPEKWHFKALWVCSLPAISVFYLTIPDCRKPNWKSWYPLTMLVSTCWVAVLTYLLLWITVELACSLNISNSTMGFTFLAIGLSFSKVVTTYLQSRAGYGYKAVYSIYGSNVFNLTVNLGLVWFIASVVRSPYVLDEPIVYVYINLCQLTIVLTPLLLQFTRWRLTTYLAVVYLVLYACFAITVILVEYY